MLNQSLNTLEQLSTQQRSLFNNSYQITPSSSTTAATSHLDTPTLSSAITALPQLRDQSPLVNSISPTRDGLSRIARSANASNGILIPPVPLAIPTVVLPSLPYSTLPPPPPSVPTVSLLPTTPAHRVYTLNCISCNEFLTDRGMRVSIFKLCYPLSLYFSNDEI